MSTKNSRKLVGFLTWFFLMGLWVGIFNAQEARAAQQVEGVFQPIAPYGTDLDGHYHKAIYDNLLGDGYYDLWMIVYPTNLRASSEYAVAIGRSPAKVQNFDDLPYFAVVSVVKTRLVMSAVPLGKNLAILEKPSPPAVTDNRVVISNEDAQSFVKTWHLGLKLVKYSDAIPGNDGVTYEFYSSGRAGQAWSPRDGVPGLLAKSGECLRRYILAPENVKGALMIECRDINEKLDAAATQQ